MRRLREVGGPLRSQVQRWRRCLQGFPPSTSFVRWRHKIYIILNFLHINFQVPNSLASTCCLSEGTGAVSYLSPCLCWYLQHPQGRFLIIHNHEWTAHSLVFNHPWPGTVFQAYVPGKLACLRRLLKLCQGSHYIIQHWLFTCVLKRVCRRYKCNSLDFDSSLFVNEIARVTKDNLFDGLVWDEASILPHFQLILCLYHSLGG